MRKVLNPTNGSVKVAAAIYDMTLAPADAETCGCQRIVPHRAVPFTHCSDDMSGNRTESENEDKSEALKEQDVSECLLESDASHLLSDELRQCPVKLVLLLKPAACQRRVRSQTATHFLARAVQNHLNAIHVAHSPKNVPAAKIPKPSPKPQTRPHKIPMTVPKASVLYSSDDTGDDNSLSCPISGGKLTMIRSIIGMSHPPGQLRTFCVNGSVKRTTVSCLTASRADMMITTMASAYHSVFNDL